MLAAGLLLATPMVLSACGDSDQQAVSSDSTAVAGTECPTKPLDVVVSVDQWGGIVSELGGVCANVTTVLASSSVDPHDYEPAPSDAALFDGAQLVVINGGHYDEWAAKLAASSAPDAPVINAVKLSNERTGDAGDDHEGHGHDAGAGDGHEGHGHDAGAGDGHEGHGHEAGAGDGHEGHGHDAEGGHDHGGGGNEHVWYNPWAVNEVAEAVTTQLGRLAPEAVGYFNKRQSAFDDEMEPYYDTIYEIQAGASGKSFAATESVFDEMAAALGLENRTPEGYQAASAHEAEPGPADLDAFLRLLDGRGVDVLIYNTQTAGSVPEQIRAAAQESGVPVVEVTETVPTDTKSFEVWQVAQLTALAEALGIPV